MILIPPLTKVKIYPENKRLKQLIKEFGSTWLVLQGPQPVTCFDGALGYYIQSIPKPMIKDIESIHKETICHERWIQPELIQKVN